MANFRFYYKISILCILVAFAIKTPESITDGLAGGLLEGVSSYVSQAFPVGRVTSKNPLPLASHVHIERRVLLMPPSTRSSLGGGVRKFILPFDEDLTAANIQT